MHKAVVRPQIRVALADDPMVIGRASVEVEFAAKGCLGAQTKKKRRTTLAGKFGAIAFLKIKSAGSGSGFDACSIPIEKALNAFVNLYLMVPAQRV